MTLLPDLAFSLSLPQIISHLPESWYQEGSVVTRPLQGLVRYLVHLAELLHRASIASPDIQRQKTRLAQGVPPSLSPVHVSHNSSPLPSRLAIQRVAKLLIKMGAQSEALAIATEYRLNQVSDTINL